MENKYSKYLNASPKNISRIANIIKTGIGGLLASSIILENSSLALILLFVFFICDLAYEILKD
ncbi:hypothetical protein UFOVP1361_5 [uncultured Caudovirales phage]|uniref:Uncharacterized protein n=1 Tax=uncultured Caudovirales phage TaxID=2100421 RepID=A0A6J5RUK5_9CAUD|nr:hypothetical protein UFOVP1361_5 [uncultured Caudovirales phage]